MKRTKERREERQKELNRVSFDVMNGIKKGDCG
jgi:hypothetical protein